MTHVEQHLADAKQKLSRAGSPDPPTFTEELDALIDRYLGAEAHLPDRDEVIAALQLKLRFLRDAEDDL